MTLPTQAIILAGGKGTRLQSIVEDMPKPMAQVNGIPFLNYIMDNLISHGIKHIVLSVGYKYEKIIEYYQNEYKGIKISYAIEKEPLGTGGAIKFASEYISEEKFWVINGDTYVDIDFEKFYIKNFQNDISLGLVKMENFDRYGVVLTKNEKISGFNEKKHTVSGLINSGIYLISKKLIDNYFPDSPVFSFEKEVLEVFFDKINIGFFETSGLFIDIGIPEDYFRSQKLFTNISDVKSIFELDSSWTIFLDRDGVINKRLPGDYVKNPSEFIFLDDVKKVIKKLSSKFNHIIVVTNQQGIGKGKITQIDVDTVNDFMLSEIVKEGGKISKIYTCGMLAGTDNCCRKPNPHMAQWAKNDFPDIDFNKSIIIGDSISDMEFGKNLGMKTILVDGKEEELIKHAYIKVDWRISGLFELI
ncbi:MAG: HAD-IIIA family hydrolase [Saprospiraceae bacterium]